MHVAVALSGIQLDGLQEVPLSFCFLTLREKDYKQRHYFFTHFLKLIIIKTQSSAQQPRFESPPHQPQTSFHNKSQYTAMKHVNHKCYFLLLTCHPSNVHSVMFATANQPGQRLVHYLLQSVQQKKKPSRAEPPEARVCGLTAKKQDSVRCVERGKCCRGNGECGEREACVSAGIRKDHTNWLRFYSINCYSGRQGQHQINTGVLGGQGVTEDLQMHRSPQQLTICRN